MQATQQDKIVLVGAGLAGSLLALFLARRGFAVEVYERRPDMRREAVPGGRSINLALSTRGLHALQQVGLDAEALKLCIAMRGRQMHDTQGNQYYQPYGTTDAHYINSISRAGLNMLLMDAAERHPGVRIHFKHRCAAFDVHTGNATFVNEATGQSLQVQGATLIATDGAGSAVRDAMLRQPGFDYSQQYLQHGYKELVMPAAPGGGFAMEKHALHIWPRGQYMLIALPNFDGSFTCTLFLAHHGAHNSFAQLSTPQAVTAFFKQHFADVLQWMPNYLEEFFGHPVGYMATIKCYPWHVGGKALLLGDSAHAIVPFYGQGMNCAFEDCVALDACIARHGTDWEKVFADYQTARKHNTDAIADLALGNFIEMRDHTANPVFLLKRKAELLLETRYPGRFLSKYSMVTFERLPYEQAMRKGNIQDAVLMDICADLTAIDAFDAEAAMARIDAALQQAGLS
jgi:kynurenine 3-monooxygenase